MPGRSPDDDLAEYLEALRGFGLPDAEIRERHGDRSLAEGDALQSAIDQVTDDDPTLEGLYDRLHATLAESSRGIDATARYWNRVPAVQVGEVLSEYGYRLSIELGESASSPFTVALTDPEGRTDEHRFSYPEGPLGEDNYPALVHAIETELLERPDLTFVLLTDRGRRWRFVLVETDDLTELRERYGDRITVFDRPLLRGTQPVDFADGAPASEVREGADDADSSLGGSRSVSSKDEAATEADGPSFGGLAADAPEWMREGMIDAGGFESVVAELSRDGGPDRYVSETSVEDVFEDLAESSGRDEAQGRRAIGRGVGDVLDRIGEDTEAEGLPELDRTATSDPGDRESSSTHEDSTTADDGTFPDDWKTPEPTTGTGGGPTRSVGERSVDDVFEELEQSAREERSERTASRSVSSADDPLPGDPDGPDSSSGSPDVDRATDTDLGVIDSSDAASAATTDGQTTPDDDGETLVGGGPDRVVADSGVEDVFEQLEESEDGAEPDVSTGSSPSADEIVSSASAPLPPDPQTSGDETATELFEEFSDEMAATVEGGDSVEAELATAGERDEDADRTSESLRFDEAMEWASGKDSSFEATTDPGESHGSASSGETNASPDSEGASPSPDSAPAEPPDGPGVEAESSTGGDEDANVDEGGPIPSAESGSSFVDVAEGREVDLDEILDEDLPVEELIDAMNEDVEVPGTETGPGRSEDGSSGPITEAEGRTPGDGDAGRSDPDATDRGAVDTTRESTTIDPDIPIRDAEAASGPGDSSERSGLGDAGSRERHPDGPPRSPDPARSADSDATAPEAVDVSSSTDDGDGGMFSAIREALEEFFN